MDSFSAIAILGAIVLVVWWWRRRDSDTVEVEAQLRRICLGDEAQMERLIEGETIRSPGLSRAEAVDRAVQRCQRDNH